MEPTLHPFSNFDATGDCQALRKAMKGLGTDEKAIIAIVGKRSHDQRLKLVLTYKTAFGRDLMSDLKSELGGKFEKVVLNLMRPLQEYLADELHKAIKGLGTDEDVLVEVLCTRSNAEVKAITAAYTKLFGKSLESDIRGDTSGDFRRLMVSMCQGNRDETGHVDQGRARQQAEMLYKAGEGKMGTDEETFNAYMATLSFQQLSLLFQEYEHVSKKTFEQAIRSETSGNFQRGLLAIVKSVQNRPAFFAERLHHSMAGAGTDDSDLIRLIVSRCEIDMVNIKREYEKMYGKSLESAISGDTSGDYKKVLLVLVSGH